MTKSGIIDDNIESIVTALRSRNALFDGVIAKKPTESDWTKEDMEEWAGYLQEEKLEPVCVFGEALILRGSSGKYFFNTYNIFRFLGTTNDQVIAYFTGAKRFMDAIVIDPYKLESLRLKQLNA